MKKILFLLLSVWALQTQAQSTKTQAQYSIDSLLPSSSSIRISEVRKAFTKTLNYLDTKVTYKTIAQVRAFTSADVISMNRVYITDNGKEGEFVYKSGSSAADNTGTVLVTSSGARYERVYSGGIKSSWFSITGDVHSGLAIRRAVNLAITKLSTSKSETVVISSGIHTLDTCSILMPVPLNTKLTILGETGNLIDFYHPNYDLGIFANATTWTYADSVYTHGEIEFNNLNFIGNRNPTPSYLSNDTGVMALRFLNMQRVEVRNCSLKSWYGSGMFVGVVGSCIIQNNNFSNVYARQPNNIDSRGDAITVFAYAKNGVITNNTLYLDNGKTGRAGISVDDKCDNIIVESNTVQGYERGIHVEGSNAVIVAKNIVRRSPIAGLSSGNKNTIWEGNFFDGTNRVCNPVLAASAVFFVLLDSACIYKDNTIKGWSGIADTYLSKFWGNDLTIDGNTFETTQNEAFVYGYGNYKRNRYLNNKFEGKINLLLDM